MDIYALETYDYTLPEGRIATHPAHPRDAARLLVWPEGEARIFSDLPELLKAGDVVVVNRSKVIPARLRGVRRARTTTTPDVPVEILLHQPRGDFTQWTAFARPAKRLRPGDRLYFNDVLEAVVEGREDAHVLVRFEGTAAEVESFLERVGDIPLPPYIARATDAADKTEYQTVYANEKGSVAAPTAGLHFTADLLQRLKEKGVQIVEVTLHVGAGTFLPVTAEDIRQHKMHAEWGRIDAPAAAAIHQAKQAGHSVVAVGTTATRLLETAARATGSVQPWEGSTDIFITPGFDFKVVDRLITNFHLPKSTLLMLVSAFMGGVEPMRALYQTAIAQNYRFYSYGDACLLTRPGKALC